MFSGLRPDINVQVFHYPPATVHFCTEESNTFTQGDESDRSFYSNIGALILHESLHWYRPDDGGGMVRDQHRVDGGAVACPDGEQNKCYGEEQVRRLADLYPHKSIRNNDSYGEFSEIYGSTYLKAGVCEAWNEPMPPPAPYLGSPLYCAVSDCCGNGVLDPEAGELCDGADFGGADRMTEVGLGQGELVCSEDCSTIDTEGCFGSCGNGIYEPLWNEACDGDDFGSQTCATFGFDLGDLLCFGCSLDLSGCSGGMANSPPASYQDCGLLAEDCEDDPDLCDNLAAQPGECLGGPCAPTDPNGEPSDPMGDFHPLGDFWTSTGGVELYRCMEDLDTAVQMTCIDEDGWGVCTACGTNEGETMKGCPCTDSNECGDDLSCFGADFPHGGRCWPDSGPPHWDCKQGRCGQSARGDGDDSEMYCEHYGSFDARCEPGRCLGPIMSITCAEDGLICDEDGDDCYKECFGDMDCSTDLGWPPGTTCNLDGTCVSANFP